jgi:subtilisin family serine protease
MINISRFSLGVVLISLLSSINPAASQVRQSITAEPRVLEAPIEVDAPRVNELVAKARTTGLVRIIVRIARRPGIPGGALSESELASAKNTFLDRAQGLRIATVEPIAGLPLSVLELNADQLRQLVAAGLISDVTEDVPEPPTLQDSIPLIHADGAALLGATGAGQTIAILDTGVEAAHPFFGGRVVAEACFSTDSRADNATTVCPGGVTASTAVGSGAPCGNAGCDHGTHVAGIAAGSDANRRGVAPQSQIMAIQVYSLFNDPPPMAGTQHCARTHLPSPCILSYQSDQIRALQQVFDWRNNFTFASVNMSTGSGSFASCDTDPRKGLIDQLRNAGIATVISSGNERSSTGVGAPGCITTAISVGATTKADAVAGFSNSANVLHLLAPGTNITSSVPGGGFAQMGGTSMAAPHVAGAVAALRSVKNNLTVDQIEQALTSTGVPITDARNNLTRPRINVEAAVRSVTTPGWSGALAAIVEYELTKEPPGASVVILEYLLQ